MKIRATKGLTFDDVLLIPKRSRVSSRQDVNTSAMLTANIKLRLPIVSANMDTVTEYKMAIAMARAGGLGIIHRFMTIEQQVNQVKRVKRAEGFIVDQPYAISDQDDIAKARRLMQRYEVGGLVVTNGNNELIGLITQRDIVLAPNDTAKVKTVMTPPDQIVSVSANVSPGEARKLLHEHRLEKLPVLDKQGHLTGLITAQDIVKYDQNSRRYQRLQGPAAGGRGYWGKRGRH